MATTALLYAEAGTGKTLLVNSIIKAVAGGEDWNGYPTKHGKVLYIQTEDNKLGSVQSTKAPNSRDCNHDGHENLNNSPLDSTKKETVNETKTSILEIGSRVANNNPEKKYYNWHGKIVGFSQGGADVCWDERKGMQGGQVLWHRLTELRLL